MAVQGTVDAVFDAAMSAVPAARRFAVDAARAWSLDEELVWSAALAVTELAANAIIHAATSFRVALSVEEDRLRVEVSDGSVRRPRLRQYGSDATTGRGLGLVASLSADWGSVPDGGGKTVWCLLAAADGVAEPEPDLDAFTDPFDELPAADAPVHDGSSCSVAADGVSTGHVRRAA